MKGNSLSNYKNIKQNYFPTETYNQNDNQNEKQDSVI